MQRRRHRLDRDADGLHYTDCRGRERVLVPIPAAEPARDGSAGRASDSDAAPIPVRVTARRPARGATLTVDGAAGPADGDRCLARPPRLTRLQTDRLVAGGETSSGADGAANAPGPVARGMIKIGHLNVQSIAAKLDDVTLLLRDQQLDILCLSETWLSPQISDLFLTFPGYDVLRQDREGRRGGGVAILHRSEMEVQQLVMPACGPLETLWTSVSWRGGRPTTVGVVYRPPDSPVTSSLEHLQEQLKAARCHGRPVFLLGDINLNILDSAAPQIRRYHSMLSELGMTQLVNRPTHLHPVPTALDHVLTDQRDPAPDVDVLPDAISDHQPVVVTARLGRVRRSAEWRTARSWRRCDWDAICLDLLEADWSAVDGATDVNACVGAFMAIWDAVFNRHCPERRVRVGKPDCPWLADDPALRALMSERDAARDTWISLRTPEAKADFTQLRNSVKSQLIRARRDYLCSELASGTRRDFWNRFKKLKSAHQPQSAAATGSPDEAATWVDRLDRHFATVGSRITDELRGATTGERCSQRPPTVYSSRFRLQPATLPELSRCIRGMSASRAVGLDGVPLFAVRRCFPVVGPHLLRLVNLSIVTGVFPECWKSACVVPIPKTDDLNHPIIGLSHF